MGIRLNPCKKKKFQIEWCNKDTLIVLNTKNTCVMNHRVSFYNRAVSSCSTNIRCCVEHSTKRALLYYYRRTIFSYVYIMVCILDFDFVCQASRRNARHVRMQASGSSLNTLEYFLLTVKEIL